MGIDGKDSKRDPEIVSKESIIEVHKELLEEMSAIEELGNSADIESRLKSLERFQEQFPNLPYGRANEYIKKMRGDPEDVVKIRADDIYGKKVKPFVDKAIRPITKMMEDFNKSLIPQIRLMGDLSSTFTASATLADKLTKSIKMPIIDLNKYPDIVDTLDKIVKSASLGLDK